MRYTQTQKERQLQGVMRYKQTQMAIAKLFAFHANAKNRMAIAKLFSLYANAKSGIIRSKKALQRLELNRQK